MFFFLNDFHRFIERNDLAQKIRMECVERKIKKYDGVRSYLQLVR